MNKKIVATLGALALAIFLTACGEDTECDSSGRLGDTATMSMVDGRSGGGGGAKTGSGSKSSSSKGGKSSSSGGLDDDWFEECDD